MKPLMEAKAPEKKRADRGITSQDLKNALSKIKSKEFKAKMVSLSKVVKSKGVLNTSKTSLTIKNNKPAEYVPIYFQAELKREKEDMGFL